MTENQKKAFDFAADVTKQLISLSSAIIALTVTFSKEIIGGVDSSAINLLIISWCVFIISIFFGVWTLLALTGTLQPLAQEKEKKADGKPAETGAEQEINLENFSINKMNVRFPAMLQILSFFIAVVITAIFGYKALNTNNDNSVTDEYYKVIRETRLSNDSTSSYFDTIYIPRKANIKYIEKEN